MLSLFPYIGQVSNKKGFESHTQNRDKDLKEDPFGTYVDPKREWSHHRKPYDEKIYKNEFLKCKPILLDRVSKVILHNK